MQSTEDIISGFHSFQALADRLAMPDSERRAVLGLTEAGWREWSNPHGSATPTTSDQMTRRLGYALPLMERLVKNLGRSEIGPGGVVQPAPSL